MSAQEAVATLQELMAKLPARFWGSIELRFQDGEIVFTSTTHTQTIRRTRKYDAN